MNDNNNPAEFVLQALIALGVFVWAFWDHVGPLSVVLWLVALVWVWREEDSM